jgi:hypothetical protein
MGYEFQQWDMHESGRAAIIGDGRAKAARKPVEVMGMFCRPWELLSEAEHAAAAALGWANAQQWDGGGCCAMGSRAPTVQQPHGHPRALLAAWIYFQACLQLASLRSLAGRRNAACD